MGNYHLSMLRSSASYASNLERLSNSRKSVINIQNNFYGQGMTQGWGGSWDSCCNPMMMTPMYYNPATCCSSGGSDKFSDVLTKGALGLQLVGSIINLFKGNKSSGT